MKQVQKQQLQQRLSPQQIQLMRLLQLPVTELEKAIKEEVENNPLLEAESGGDTEDIEAQGTDNDVSDWDVDDDYDFRDHMEADPNPTWREFTVADSPSALQRLSEQLISTGLTPHQQAIATELLGSLDDAGYLSRDIDLIANDMAFRQGFEATPGEVEEVLAVIQSLEPAGIGARTLQECLLLQLRRMNDTQPEVRLATNIVEQHFDDFANRRYERIAESLKASTTDVDKACNLIRHLNPKPGDSGSDSDSTATFITPDIILYTHDDEIAYQLNDSHLPHLSLNEYYTQMLSQLEHTNGDRETIQFLRTKQTDAQGFIDLLAQRHNTIVRIMDFIVDHQRQYLLTGDPDTLLPLRQREVAEATGLDISTVSRMANSKYLQTPFGTIPLKDCFSKGMTDTSGNELSIDTIKQRLADAIASENKNAPLSDEDLAQQLNQQGIPLARRTVAKYREQLGIPVARLRRLLVVLLLLIANHSWAQMSYYDSIVNARLQAAAAIDKPAPKTEKAAKATPSRTPKNTPQNTPPTATAQAAPTEPAPTMAADLNIVPTWYDAFPQHRVNPMGRTRLDMMPDEINLRLVHDTADFCFPVRNIKTSNYGWRWQRGHHGVDIRLNTGDPVRCAFSGTVRVAAPMGGYGNCIVVRHPNGLETLYGHLSKINVKPHQQVHAGDTIGLGGSTGNSTGPHLHFEVRFLYQTFDPEWILDFNNYTLRTQRLHLDKSYFGIHQPQKGQNLNYKADQSIIRETKKNRRSQQPTYDASAF